MSERELRLRAWQETGIEYELRLLFENLASDQSFGRIGSALLAHAADPTFMPRLVLGFGDGFLQGAHARLTAWKEDVQRLFEAARRVVQADHAAVVMLTATTVGLGLRASLREFFVRPWLEQAPAGLSPQTQAEVQTLIDLHGAGPFLDWLSILDEALGDVSLAKLLSIAADDLAAALVARGGAHMMQILTERDPDKLGAFLGEPLGAGTVELVRLIVEPPALDVAQLVALLALSADEMTALGLKP